MIRSLGGRLLRAAVGAIFGAWFVVVTLSQDPRRKWDKLRNYDKSGALVPDWRFFAPHPGMHDHDVLVRDELPDGSMTEWRQATNIEERRLSHTLWYVDRRKEKALLDAMTGLIKITEQEEFKNNKEALQVTIPYLTLLNHVTYRVQHHPEAKRTQFIVVNSDGYAEEEEPNMIFLSNPHPLT